jgi:hypothetical protein
MIINNFHNVIFIITVQVFHQHYYDEVTQAKCSLSSERRRFESIINQLVIYSLHKPHSPTKVRYWSPSQLSRKILSLPGTTCIRGPSDCLSVLSSRPRVLPYLLRYSALRAIHLARIISQLRGRKIRYSTS